MARELKRLEAQLASSMPRLPNSSKRTAWLLPTASNQLAALRADFNQKSALYAPSHPALKPLQQQIDALEKVVELTAEFMANSKPSSGTDVDRK